MLKPYIQKVVNQVDLSMDEAHEAMKIIMTGEATPAPAPGPFGSAHESDRAFGGRTEGDGVPALRRAVPASVARGRAVENASGRDTLARLVPPLSERRALGP